MITRSLALILVIAATGCARENIPIAGGELTGNLATSPMNWTALANTDIIQLETRPEDPYSVNLWIVADENTAYIYAGENQATWVEHLEVNPNARLRVNSYIYPVIAERVTSPEEFKSFAEAWHAKYDSNGPRDTNEIEAYLYRLAQVTDNQ